MAMMNRPLNFRTLDLNLLRVFDQVMAERNLTVDHVSIWRWGAGLRAGTQPARPPGTADDKSVVALQTKLTSGSQASGPIERWIPQAPRLIFSCPPGGTRLLRSASFRRHCGQMATPAHE